MEEKKNAKKEAWYKKWWVWAIVIVVMVALIKYIDTGNASSKNDSENVSTSSEQSKESSNVTNTNPYEETNEYDGIYKFVLNSDNGAGHIFTAKGAISFKGGICEAKYVINSDTIPEYNREYNGFCGINKDDNSNFYFSLNNNEIIYQCSKSDNNLFCKLKSEYNLSGCSNSELVLTHADNSQTIDIVLAQVIEEEKIKKEAEEKAKKEKEEQDFKASCQTYTFEQMARNPDNFKGTNVKLTGEVVQAMYGTYSTDLRVNITKEGRYSTYYTDTIYVTYYPKAGEDKILENDIITIYGTAQGDYSYTSTLGATITLPMVQGKYIVIEK